MPITTLLAILILLLLYFLLSNKYPSFPDRLSRFWKYSKNNKHPTLADIRRKYPKRLSQEQLRKQARAKDEAEARRKQEIIDRNIQQIRANNSINKASNSINKPAQNQETKFTIPNNLGKVKNYDQGHGVRREAPSQRDISVGKFRKLVKMVHGREDVARRLIEGNMKLFPDKSPDWACDKAITDLERDRRA